MSAHSGIRFSIWTVDEPEFLCDAEYKFNILTHPVHMAMGTGGKNDHLALETIDGMASWALRKLLSACIKVGFWCGLQLIYRGVGWIMTIPLRIYRAWTIR